MSASFASVVSLCTVYWAAMFAEVAHLRALDDGAGAVAFGFLSGALLMASLGFFLAAASA
jgi:hypothetical protein